MNYSFDSVTMSFSKNLVFLIIVLSFFTYRGMAQSEGYKTSEKNLIDTSGSWTYHFQMTTIYQEHPSFNALYSGQNSLNPHFEDATSLTTTLFLGRELWKGASLYFNPEVAGGKGLSGTLGTGSPFNGETFKIGNPSPTSYVARLYLHQYFPIGNTPYETKENDKNQTLDRVPSSRLVVNIGKFCLADFFDDNKYAHDPRAQFMNWSLMSNTAWDYAANTRGYTSGIVVEIIKPLWAARISSAMVPTVPNGPNMDNNVLKAHSETAEFEHKIGGKGHRGKVRLLAYHTISKAPNYQQAINAMAKGDSSLIPVFQGTREWYTYGGVKYGFGISYDQALTADIGVFARAGWADGHTAIWAFTEVDHQVSAGLSIKATKIHRPQDVFGIAYVAAGLSHDHLAYLQAGGLTFGLGDGKLTNPGAEQVLESFYCYELTSSLWLSLDYQFMLNPGYNRDRGPVNVFGFRFHVEI